MSTRTLKVCVAISGSGRTLMNLIDHEADHNYEVICVVGSKTCTGLNFAKESQIPYYVHNFSNEDENGLTRFLEEHNPDIIALAGFLKKWPLGLSKNQTVLNIHPALLPKFGGKGMYGMNVHRSVIESGEKESGATIHFVSENYDEGRIVAQAKVSVDAQDSPELLAARVFEAECSLYPQVIHLLADGTLPLEEDGVWEL